MITDGTKWHYLAVKVLSALIRAIASNHNGDFCCLNGFHSYSTKEKLEKHEKLCNDHDYCYIEIPNDDNKILKYNHGGKSLKAPLMIYADWECLLEKIHSCQNNPEKSDTEKKIKYTPSSYSMFTNCSFGETKNKLDCYGGETCMERFCKDWIQHAMKIINFEEKRMILLADKEKKFYEKQKVCYTWKKNCSDEKDKNEFTLYRKVRDHCHYTGKFRGAAHGICNLRYKTPKEIP